MFKLSFEVLGLFHFVWGFFISTYHAFFLSLAFLAALLEQRAFVLRYL